MRTVVEGRNHGEGCPGFEHPREGRVPQIVEPALHPETLLRSFPGFLPAANWLGGIGAVRAGSFEAISRRAVSLGRTSRGAPRSEGNGFAAQEPLLT